MRIVTIGGGTGTFTVLRGLSQLAPHVNLEAVVSVADSGGSGGRLRDEFGYLPMGDMRQALAALADTDNGQNLLRELFLYRFNKGELSGHNFGNLFLVAMTDILGSEEKAIEYAAKVLRVKGRVLPVSKDDVHLVAQYDDGSVLKGETHIDEPPATHDGTIRITKVSLDPKGEIWDSAKEAIENADMVVLGPGDLYTSIVANLLIGGVPEALKNAKGMMVYVVNLMTKYGQTHGFSASDHVKEIAKYAGREPDVVIINDAPMPESLLSAYKDEQASPVVDDLPNDALYAIIRADLLPTSIYKKPEGDTLMRSLIRHDQKKLAATLLSIG